MIKITQHIEFEFKDRELSDLQELNRLLASLKLEKLELKNSRGYLSVTRDGKGNLLEKRYGLDSGTLICTLSEQGNSYQIDTAVTGRTVDHEVFVDLWRSYHPGRLIRTVITLEFESDTAFVILHHQRN